MSCRKAANAVFWEEEQGERKHDGMDSLRRWIYRGGMRTLEGRRLGEAQPQAFCEKMRKNGSAL